MKQLDKFEKRETYPEVACTSNSGQDGLRRQNMSGGRSVLAPAVLRRKEPTLRGEGELPQL